MTAPRMSKTAALKVARHAVDQIRRCSSTHYVFWAPYFSHRPDGPNTEIHADSYPKALASRTETVAYVALALMGHSGVFLRPGSDYDGTTAEKLVRAGIARAGRHEARIALEKELALKFGESRPGHGIGSRSA